MSISMTISLGTPIRRSLAVAVLTMFGLGTAVAGPAYQADDVVRHFSAQTDLGAPRALCIGTESDCQKRAGEQPKPADGFNLRVSFGYNSADLLADARANLDEFARALRDPRLSGTHFAVEGHTDGAGSDAFNLDLSMRRANAVVQYLGAHGIDAGRLDAKGYGKQKPLVGDPMSADNRRVETRLRTE